MNYAWYNKEHVPNLGDDEPSGKRRAGAKAYWLRNYLIARGIPGLRSRDGHVTGLHGWVLSVARFRVGAQAETRLGFWLNLRAKDNHGKKVIGVRMVGASDPEHVVVFMRLPDFAELLSEVVNGNPRKWLANIKEAESTE